MKTKNLFRCELKNFCNIIFYSIPKNVFIYQNLISALVSPDLKTNVPSFKNQVKCIFTKYDALYLEKIVGSDSVKEFLAEYNKASTFIV